MSDIAKMDLDSIGAWFQSLLAVDPEPRGRTALFWHEVARPGDGPSAKPITRGPHFLEYYDRHRPVGEVPGQTGLAKHARPEPRCRALMSANAGTPESLCRIFLRYDYVETTRAWSRLITTETFAQFDALLKARAEFDFALASHFHDLWNPKVIDMGFQYGIPISRPEPGPFWRVQRDSDGQITNELQAPTERMLSLLRDLESLFAAHGRRHIHEFSFATRDPSRGLTRAAILYC